MPPGIIFSPAPREGVVVPTRQQFRFLLSPSAGRSSATTSMCYPLAIHKVTTQPAPRIALGAGELPEEVFVHAAEDVPGAAGGVAQADVAVLAEG
jgi:hypothetical protein